MILTAKQNARLGKLLASLGLYALEQEGDAEALRELERGNLDGWVGAQIVDYIWGEDRVDGLIDRFVEENPAHLNRRDLKQVEDWKSAVFGDYIVVRKRNDVYFLAEDVGFVVRGIDGEIDRFLAHVPALVTTAVVPFDGLVTYAIGVAERDQEENPYLNESVALAHIDELQRARRIARSERDFMRLSKEFADVLWRRHRERSADPAAMIADRFDDWYHERERALSEDGKFASTDALAPLFERVLARYGDFDRADEFLRTQTEDAILDAFLQEPTVDDMLDEIDRMCLPGEPAYHLKDILVSYDDARLRTMCGVMLGLDEEALSARSRDELAEEVARLIVERPENLLQLILREGEEGAKDIRRLMEAGGSLLLRTEDLGEDDLDSIVIPFLPFIFAYHEGDDYRYVMPDEMREALRDVDLDHLEADANSLEYAGADIVTALGYRGIAPADDLAKEALGHYELHLDIETILSALALRVGLRYVPCAVCFIDEVPHLINLTLLDACEGTTEPGSGILTDPTPANTILKKRSRIRPRPIDELGDDQDLVDHLMDLPSWRRLEDALSQYSSTDNVTLFVLMDVVELFATDYQFDEDGTEAFWDVLDEVGIEVPVRHRKKIVPAIEAFMDDIPRWDLNGWSHSDLGECTRVR